VRYHTIFYTTREGYKVERRAYLSDVCDYISYLERSGCTDIGYFVDEDMTREPSEREEWASFDPDC